MSSGVVVPSTWAAFKWNVITSTNELWGWDAKIGWDMSSNMTTYKWVTDVVQSADERTWYDPIRGEIFSDNDPTFTNLMINEETVFYNAVGILTTTDAATAAAANEKFNLFGLPYLPWNAVYLPDSSGTWTGMQRYDDNTLMRVYNPLRREVLMRKARSLVTLAAAGTLLFLGGRYAYGKYNQYQ